MPEQSERSETPEQELARITARLAVLSSAEKPSSTRRDAKRALRALQQQPGGSYMRIYTARAIEIREDLAAELAGQKHVSLSFVLHVLDDIVLSLSDRSQRMSKTTAELAKDMGVSPAQMSRAFKALASVDAVVSPLQAGKSRTWEVDASYASAMPESARQVAIIRQEAGRPSDEIKPELQYRDGGPLEDAEANPGLPFG